MKVRTFKRVQHIPASLDEVFAFFSRAENLARMTPSWLGFEILTPLPIEMRAGAVIDYRIGFAGIPMRWRTLIRSWDPPYAFVDEQLEGPYRTWIHTHRFEAVADGVIMTDEVKYALPLGALGDFAHALGVRRSLRAIFDFRQQTIHEVFGAAAA